MPRFLVKMQDDRVEAVYGCAVDAGIAWPRLHMNLYCEQAPGEPKRVCGAETPCMRGCLRLQIRHKAYHMHGIAHVREQQVVTLSWSCGIVSFHFVAAREYHGMPTLLSRQRPHELLFTDKGVLDVLHVAIVPIVCSK